MMFSIKSDAKRTGFRKQKSLAILLILNGAKILSNPATAPTNIKPERNTDARWTVDYAPITNNIVASRLLK
nr:hypothetical protein [Micavibrio aeruginosavorus]